MNAFQPGVIVPLVTPLRKGRLDSASLTRLIDHVIAGGVNGVFVLGTTGEGPSFDEKTQMRVIAEAAERIAGRTPLLVGCAAASFAASLRLADAAYRAGADAAVYAGPIYVPLAERYLQAHVERFAAKAKLPVVLYNIPSHARCAFTAKSVVRLAKAGAIQAFKDSGGGIALLRRCRQTLPPDFPLYVGPEEHLSAALRAGLSGGVCGGANIFPRLYSLPARALQAGMALECKRLHAAILRVGLSFYGFPGGLIPGMKSALEAAGLCGAEVAEPLLSLPETFRSRARSSYAVLAGAIHELCDAVEKQLKRASRGEEAAA